MKEIMITILCLVLYTMVAFPIIGKVYAQIPLSNIQADKTQDEIQVVEDIVPVNMDSGALQPYQRSKYIEQALSEANNMPLEVVQKEESLLHPWKEALTFELSLNKLRSFIIAGRVVQGINREWDTLIAAAENDELAIEYQQQMNNETANAISTIPDITLEEYKELYRLSLKDGSFSMILRALKKQIYTDE